MARSVRVLLSQCHTARQTDEQWICTRRAGFHRIFRAPPTEGSHVKLLSAGVRLVLDRSSAADSTWADIWIEMRRN